MLCFNFSIITIICSVPATLRTHVHSVEYYHILILFINWTFYRNLCDHITVIALELWLR